MLFVSWRLWHYVSGNTCNLVGNFRLGKDAQDLHFPKQREKTARVGKIRCALIAVFSKTADVNDVTGFCLGEVWLDLHSERVGVTATTGAGSRMTNLTAAAPAFCDHGPVLDD